MQTARTDDGPPAAGGIDFCGERWSMWGEIDMSALLEVESQALRHLAESSGELVIDLARVTFMDSAGLRLLGRVASSASAVRLEGLPPAVREVLELSAMLPLFELDGHTPQSPNRPR